MKRGGILNPYVIALLVVFGGLMLLPIVLAEFFPIIKIILVGFFCIGIYSFVRNMIGPGILSYVIAGILIYILVIRLWYLYASVYMVYLIASLGLSGIIMFGLQGVGMKKEEHHEE